jgi:hypothetical protein
MTTTEAYRLSRPKPGDTRYSSHARLTNHRDLLPGLDGRSQGARRYRDILKSLLEELGGAENVTSEAKLGFVRSLAATTVLLEAVSARAVAGEPVDPLVFCTLTSTTIRLQHRLGLTSKREVKDSKPGLSDYLENANHESEESAA